MPPPIIYCAIMASMYDELGSYWSIIIIIMDKTKEDKVRMHRGVTWSSCMYVYYTDRRAYIHTICLSVHACTRTVPAHRCCPKTNACAFGAARFMNIMTASSTAISDIYWHIVHRTVTVWRYAVRQSYLFKSCRLWWYIGYMIAMPQHHACNAYTMRLFFVVNPSPSKSPLLALPSSARRRRSSSPGGFLSIDVILHQQVYYILLYVIHICSTATTK